MSITIGLLLPRSDMFPTLGLDLMNGLKLALKSSRAEGVESNFLIEGIGNAVDAGLLKTAEKFILQEDVTITIAFCGFNQLTELVSIFNNYKKPLICIDLGGFVLNKEQTSPYVLYHTLNIWQSAYAAGKYAAKEYGKKGSVIASMYDGGYHISAAFVEGFVNAGGTIASYYVSPMEYKSESFESMVTGLREAEPEVVFALFSYKEGQKVFDILAKSDLNGSIQILATPLMMDESNNTEDLQIKNVTSIATWAFDDEYEAMQDFVSNYTKVYEDTPNCIGILGFEVGLTISNCITAEGTVPAKLADAFQNKSIDTPRGQLRYNMLNESQIETFKVREIQYNKTKYQSAIVDTIDASFSETLYEVFENLPHPAWQNPYICT